MRGFGGGIKSNFLISFGVAGQRRAGRAKHFAALHFLALLFPHCINTDVVGKPKTNENAIVNIDNSSLDFHFLR